MAAAKREIYARMATQLLTHERCTIAEVACPGAMGLYLFLVMQARHEKTRGETLEALALASWSAPTSYRRKQAAALIVAGLVERRDGRLVVIRYLDHNDGPEEIEANRERSNKRYKDWQQRHHKRVGDALSPSSISCSSSLSESGSRSEEPTSSPRAIPPDPPSRPHNDSDAPCAVPASVVQVADPSAPPPDWWTGTLETIHASVGVQLAPGECWLAYAGHRASPAKRLPATRADALQWLVQVMVPKAREALRVAARDRERDAKWDATRKAERTPAPAPYHAPAGRKGKAPEEREPTDEERAETRRLAAQMGNLFAVPKTGTE